jgi:hypothetical protein
MLAQMAATAGSVAVGSTIGHGISNMLFGGGSAAAETAPDPALSQGQQSQMQAASCEGQAKGMLSFSIFDFIFGNIDDVCRVHQVLGKGRLAILHLVPRAT